MKTSLNQKSINYSASYSPNASDTSRLEEIKANVTESGKLTEGNRARLLKIIKHSLHFVKRPLGVS